MRPTAVLVHSLILAGLAVTAALLLEFQRHEGPHTSSEVVRTRPDVTFQQLVHRVEGRAQYAVCLDSVGALTLTGSQIAIMRRALDEAFVALPQISHQLTVGCRPPVAGKRPGARPLDFADEARRLTATETPSPYVVAVYVLPGDLYDAAFEDAYPYAVLAEEAICSGDSCDVVTTGLYVTPNVSVDQLRYAFLDIEGLAPEPYDACTVTDPEIYRGLGYVVDPVPDLWWCNDFWKAVEAPPP
jgi:hypothetical protein